MESEIGREARTSKTAASSFFVSSSLFCLSASFFWFARLDQQNIEKEEIKNRKMDRRSALSESACCFKAGLWGGAGVERDSVFLDWVNKTQQG